MRNKILVLSFISLLGISLDFPLENNVIDRSTCVMSNSYNNVKYDFTLVIDAGHGGKDNGTSGLKSREKDVTLAIALKLGKMIESSDPRVNVIYTRTDDTFIPLFERIAIANKANADLFISIHCNASAKKSVTGTETFVMGLHKAEENIETAKRENSSILLESDFEQNYDGFDPNSDIGHIILSMYQNSYLDQSIEFASFVEKSFGVKTSRGVKQAGFVVLRRATMPSVLVETGFLSNKKEEKRLKSRKGQLAITKSLFNAFTRYKIATIQLEKEIAIEGPESEISNKEIQNQYTVQIAATSEDKRESFSNIEDLQVLKKGAFYRYTSGTFTTREEAEKVKQKMVDKGYKSAFIVVYQMEGSVIVQK